MFETFILEPREQINNKPQTKYIKMYIKSNNKIFFKFYIVTKSVSEDFVEYTDEESCV